jgi:hypothetical protein
MYPRPITHASTHISNTTQKGPTFKDIYQRPVFKPIDQDQDPVFKSIDQDQDPVFIPIARRPAEN